MRKLLALINWPIKIIHDDDTAEEFDLPFTVDTHRLRRNPEEETRPMYRFGNRDPKDVQRDIDLAG